MTRRDTGQCGGEESGRQRARREREHAEVLRLERLVTAAGEQRPDDPAEHPHRQGDDEHVQIALARPPRSSRRQAPAPTNAPVPIQLTPVLVLQRVPERGQPHPDQRLRGGVGQADSHDSPSAPRVEAPTSDTNASSRLPPACTSETVPEATTLPSATTATRSHSCSTSAIT